MLSILLLHPENQYHVREIARLTGTAAGSLHRELLKLSDAEILIRQSSGKHVYYQANKSCIIYEELASILKKSSGLLDYLSSALLPLADRIDLAFIFGSIAKNTESSNSDVDVLIVSELSFAEFIHVLHPVQIALGRDINPKIYSPKEWKLILKNPDEFIKNILHNPKLFIIGSDNEFK